MNIASKRFAVLLAGLLFAGAGLAVSNPFQQGPGADTMLAAVSRTTHALDGGLDVPVTVTPEASQVKATRFVTYFLSTYHYKKVALDDDLSAKILKRYLDSLDPSHSYFLAKDIKAFDRFKSSLDDELKEADLSAPFAIFNIYLARLKDRMNYASSLLADDKNFDFTVDENYEVDRSDAPWPEDRDAQNELWRKRVKNDYLSLKLADKEPGEIRKTLLDRYQGLAERMGQLDSEDVFQLFMNSYAGSIEPHTAYLSPRTSENFQIAMSLSFEGIGAVLQRDDEYTTIRRIVPGGPASKDGRLKPGDRIVGVAQGPDKPMVDVVGWRLDDVVDLIRGPKDSMVRLDILPVDRGIKGPSEEVALTRNKVELEEQSAQKSVIDLKTENGTRRIGVIEVPSFYIDFAARARDQKNYRSTTRDVRKLIGELEKDNVDGLVIDLRGNGGGSLLEATELTGLFIDTGPVVQVKDSSGDVSVERDTDPGVAWDGPLAVLVDRYSASASEIFAAAIQDYGRGIVVGEPTYGKGTVQNLIDLDNFNELSDKGKLGQLKITTAQFFRVNGASTQHRGVTPDITWPTVVDRKETGESAYDNALPWADISAADYKPVSDLDPVLAKASALHASRVAHSDKFQGVVKDIDEYYHEQDTKTVSLLESERRKEFKEAEAKRADRFDEEESPPGEGNDDAKPEDDVLLDETAHILADVVRLTGNDTQTASVEHVN